MHKALTILSQVWSILLYPMLMPLYGTLLLCVALSQLSPQMPAAYWIICLAGTTFLTIIIPICLLLYMRHRGYIDSLLIHNPKQRTAPYIYTLMCYGFWACFLRISMRMPLFLLLIVIGAMLALLAVTIINRWWKISAHLTAIGGLLGGVCSFAINYATMPRTLIIIILAAALLLMYARLYINAHTPLQVVCGFLLGLILTFTPTLIFAYA